MNLILADDPNATVNMVMMLGTLFVIFIIPGIVLWIVFAARAARRKKQQPAPKE